MVMIPALTSWFLLFLGTIHSSYAPQFAYELDCLDMSKREKGNGGLEGPRTEVNFGPGYGTVVDNENKQYPEFAWGPKANLGDINFGANFVSKVN